MTNSSQGAQGEESSAAGPAGEVAVLLLSNGMSCAQLTDGVAELKSASKSCGTHKQREFYWQAYSQILSAVSGQEGEVHGFVTYRAPAEEGEEGAVEFKPLTGKQKQMLAGSVEILGKKFRPADEENQKGKCWFMCWFGEDAAAALEDITRGEPVVYCNPDSVFVGTRLKRKKCKNSSTVKTDKELDAFIESIQPCLQSIRWSGPNEPPRLNDYNLVLCGGWSGAVVQMLPPTVGYVDTTSVDCVYEYFLERRNASYLSEAEKMIDQMLADVQKGESKPLIVAGSMKEAGAARKNCLMKKVFVSESKKQFVQKVREEGEVEMVVIKGDSPSKFADYGSIVFEMFYRANLEDFMY